MATSSAEFEPFEYLSRVVSLWWLIVICAVLGAVSGLIVHRFKAPLYEAKAVFMASIDFNKIDLKSLGKNSQTPYELTQYDEDISLVVVESSLRQVEPQVVAYAQKNGLAIDVTALEDISTIERKHGFWELRLRSSDPALAQKMVNFWAQTGYADLLAKQKANQLPPYIFFNLTQLAELPQRPMFFQTNVFVLAGMVIGLVAGVFLVNLPVFKPRRHH